MLEITQELIDRLRSNPDFNDASQNNFDCSDFDSDLFPIWERGLRPDLVITSYRIARRIIDLYSDITRPITWGEVEYTAIYFAGPLPTTLSIIPCKGCEGEYFILDSEHPENVETQAYRKNLAE